MCAAIPSEESVRKIQADYPAYEAITVNGITQIIEHKKMEPIFYVTDDAAVAKQFSCS